MNDIEKFRQKLESNRLDELQDSSFSYLSNWLKENVEYGDSGLKKIRTVYNSSVFVELYFIKNDELIGVKYNDVFFRFSQVLKVSGLSDDNRAWLIDHYIEVVVPEVTQEEMEAHIRHTVGKKGGWLYS